MRNEREVLHLVLLKAWQDREFRKRLQTNPLEEIEKLTGASVLLPEGKTLVVCDQTDDSKVYFNIPVEPRIENMELNEYQIEAVAGGLRSLSISGEPYGIIKYIQL